MAVTTTQVSAQKHGRRPVVLVVAGNWWPLSARLALALDRHGCEVIGVCPPGHPLRSVRCVARNFTYRALASRASVVAAIRQTQPDLIVPCDDRTAAQLHEIHGRYPDLRPLIERSLGSPNAYDVLQSRDGLMRVAIELGIRAPNGCLVAGDTQVASFHTTYGPSSLVKLDGTYGGHGVRIVHSEAEAVSAFRQLSSPIGVLTALKRLIVNRDPLALWSWNSRKPPRVSMQQFIGGIPANCMVACWQGEILAQISVQAVACQGPTGAANIVRLIDNEEMTRAARLLASRLQLSGFFGLDFMIQSGSGTAFLIELNPRCTQLGHLQVSDGDLAGALVAKLQGRGRQSAKSALSSETIAFFPQALQWGAEDSFLNTVHHDVPWEAPDLVKALLRDSWPDRRLLARAYHFFRQRERPQALAFPPLPVPLQPGKKSVSRLRARKATL